MSVLVGLHSLWRWVVLLVMLIALVRGLLGWLRGGAWTGLDRRLTLAAVSAIDIQALLGIIVWLGERRWDGSNPFLSFIHPLVMLVALAVAHAGSARLRRESEPAARYRWLTLSVVVVLVLVTAAIPSYSWGRAWSS